MSATALLQGALSCWQLFVAGSSFALGVFVPYVERAAKPINALNDVWEIGMGAMHFASGPIMIAATFILTGNETLFFPQIRRKSTRLRLLASVTLLAYLALSVSAYGTSNSSRVLLFFGVTVQAFPLAIGTHCTLQFVVEFSLFFCQLHKLTSSL